MSQRTRRELVERLRHAVLEGEAAFWARIKEIFPEAVKGQELPASLVAGVWNVLDGMVQAWAIEHVPGMVEALANEKQDRDALDRLGSSGSTQTGYDERDQT